MKRQSIFLSCFIGGLLFVQHVNAQFKKLDVEFNVNIATYSIVEFIVAENQGRLFYIDGKADVAFPVQKILGTVLLPAS